MALATRCPNCSAIFRVGAEQLTSRGGMVRCGSCRHVFNAIGCLDYVEPNVTGADSPPPRSGGAGRVEPEHDLHRPAPPPAASAARTPPRKPEGAARSAPPVPSKPAAAPGAGATAAPVIHGLAALSQPPPEGAPAPEQPPGFLFDATPTLPATGAPHAADPTDPTTLSNDLAIPELEPTFLRSRSSQTSPVVRIGLWAASGLLGVALVVQLAMLFRSGLLIHFPELQPALAALCEPLACSAQWPMRPELLAVVSSELQAVPGTEAMELDAVIRNRAEFAVALPSLELTLTDSLNRPVARKVFGPADYLAARTTAAPVPGENLAAGADLSIRLVFEFRGAGVVGFVAYPFYP